MTDYTRANAWNEGGTFDNADLLWYAKGVGKMMERTLDKPDSWWFFAAIHGEYVDPATVGQQPFKAFPAWKFIESPPSVSVAPLPKQTLAKTFWNQCQHGSWYFLPWHRGYLLALEAQLRADIVSLNGPDTWALPYWDYFGGAQAAEALIPPAFTVKTLPDGSPNPLYVAMRYGPDNNGAIYVPTKAYEDTHGSAPGWNPASDVTSVCMQNTLFTDTDGPTPMLEFGGPQSGFSHNGGPHGNMESNPHDMVHGYVGGSGSGPASTDLYGLMADPGTAALDPIFYLHHCNIDRMWSVWNAAGNHNPIDDTWLRGPAQQFIMPMPQSESWVYTPGDVQDLASLNYTYQDAAAPPQVDEGTLAHRLAALGAATSVTRAPAAAVQPQPAELLGANAGPVQVASAGATLIDVALHPQVQQRVLDSLGHASSSAPPDQLFLKLENIRGTHDATVLRVYIDLPADPDRDALLAHHAGSVALFGLRRASVQQGQHGGAGLTFVLDISQQVDQLVVQGKLATGCIQVTLLRANESSQQHALEIGRVSIYRAPY